MPLAEMLQEMEQPPFGCERIDMERVLQLCGYTVVVKQGTVFCAKLGWRPFTFQQRNPTVGADLSMEILRYIRDRAEREGLL